MLTSNESRRVNEFPESLNHTILYKLNENKDYIPYPLKFINKWDEHHVRMPCSSLSFCPIINNDRKSLIPRWQVIEHNLKNIVKNVYDIQKAILGYNKKFESQWNFNVLIELFENELCQEYKRIFFMETYPAMVDLALNLPNLVTKPIPLLKSNKLHSISLSQMQIASLLANAFFCTYPRRNKLGNTSEYRGYPNINFSSLFNSHNHQGSISNKTKIEKLKCILHYFKRITENPPVGIVTFTRRVLDQSHQINWEDSNQTFEEISLQTDYKNSIFTSGIDSIKIDFANKFVGGGALNNGCVQEEILFVTQPELIVSRLFTDTLGDHESLLVQGTEIFCLHKGYSQTFEFDGDFNETEICLSKRDDYGRWKNTISMIDALFFKNFNDQFTKNKMYRDLNKAYCGFSNIMPFDDCLPNTISTGNWGCGVYGGDIYLKFILQLMACVELKKNIIYYTFGNQSFAREIVDVFNFLRDYKCTIGNLWNCLQNFNQEPSTLKLFDFIKAFVVK